MFIIDMLDQTKSMKQVMKERESKLTVTRECKEQEQEQEQEHGLDDEAERQRGRSRHWGLKHNG